MQTKHQPHREKESVVLLAEKIDANKIFSPGEEDNGIPFNETLDWLSQYTHGDNGEPLNPNKSYLLIGDETAPEEIWESVTNDPTKNNRLDAQFKRIWVDPDMKEWDVTIQATVTKVIRTRGRDEDHATENAHQIYSADAHSQEPERYNQETIKAVEVENDES